MVYSLLSPYTYEHIPLIENMSNMLLLSLYHISNMNNMLCKIMILHLLLPTIPLLIGDILRIPLLIIIVAACINADTGVGAIIDVP